jgi:hypothetical protein
MRHVFCCFCRSHHSVSESKNGISITFVQNLKSRRASLRCLFQQPFVCFPVYQSKRSILQELASYLFITANGQKVAEKIARFRQFISASQLYYRFAPVEHPYNLAGDRALMR